MPHAVSIGIVSALALVLNAPLGYWREGCRKFSVAWFVAIHASVPLLIAARLLLGVSWLWIPAFISLAVIGQWLGGRARAGRGRSPSRR